MNPDTFEITGNDRFKAKASAVFAFDQVTLRPACPTRDPPSVPPSSTDPKSPPCVLPAGHLARPQSDPVGAQRVTTDDFKGRESLFRVPDHEWDRPSARPTRAHEGEDRRRVLELRHNDPWKKDGQSERVPRETFRRPQNPRPRPPRSHHRVPDFKRNPDKYQKYTLKDVDLTSNRGNSQAAFAFLDEIKQRKRKRDAATDAEESEQERRMRESGQIQFKPRGSQTSSTASSTSSTGSSSPSSSSSTRSTESQGPRTSSSTTAREPKKPKATPMMLSHLMEDDDED